MTPRRVTAAVCLVAIVLLLMGAFSRRWLVADLRSDQLNASLRIGLTKLSMCATTVEASVCQQLSWSEVHGLEGVHVEGSSWMWLGRLTFALSLFAAAALAALAVLAVLDRPVVLPIPLPRIAMWSCIALLPFMGGYYALTPGGFSAIAAGRGFLFAGLGAVAGLVAAFRETDDGLA